MDTKGQKNKRKKENKENTNNLTIRELNNCLAIVTWLVILTCAISAMILIYIIYFSFNPASLLTEAQTNYSNNLYGISKTNKSNLVNKKEIAQDIKQLKSYNKQLFLIFKEQSLKENK